MKAHGNSQATAEIDHILAEITQMNKEHIPFSTQVVVIEVQLKKWKERLLGKAIAKETKMTEKLKELYEEGLLDVTVLYPESRFDDTGALRSDLPEGYAEDEIHILHMNQVTGVSLPGCRYDRRLSDANFEWEHVESADLHHPSILEYLEAQQ